MKSLFSSLFCLLFLSAVAVAQQPSRTSPAAEKQTAAIASADTSQGKAELLSVTDHQLPNASPGVTESKFVFRLNEDQYRCFGVIPQPDAETLKKAQQHAPRKK